MPVETIIGIPEPEDKRTPEQKYADNLDRIARDGRIMGAVATRRWDETNSRIANPNIYPPQEEAQPPEQNS